MPQRAREIADLSAAQSDVLDLTDGLAEVDGVTDAVLSSMTMKKPER